MTAAVSIALGFALGWLSGGTVDRLRAAKFSYEIPIAVAFVMQALARGQLPGTRYSQFALPIWALAGVVLVGLTVWAQDGPGMKLVGIGTALNLLVTMMNGGMPVTAEGVSGLSEAIARSAGFYSIADNGTMMAFLGDCLPIAGYVASPGDVILCVGVLVFIAAGMLGVGRVGPT